VTVPEIIGLHAQSGTVVRVESEIDHHPFLALQNLVSEQSDLELNVKLMVSDDLLINVVEVDVLNQAVAGRAIVSGSNPVEVRVGPVVVEKGQLPMQSSDLDCCGVYDCFVDELVVVTGDFA